MAEIPTHPLLNLIREKMLLDEMQIEEVSQEHVKNGKPIEKILHDGGYIDKSTQLQVIADEFLLSHLSCPTNLLHYSLHPSHSFQKTQIRVRKL